MPERELRTYHFAAVIQGTVKSVSEELARHQIKSSLSISPALWEDTDQFHVRIKQDPFERLGET